MSDSRQPAGAMSVPRRQACARLALVALLAGSGWLAVRAARRGPQLASGPVQWPAVSYRLVNGQRLGPDDLLGRVVLVNFWATTCSVCVAEMADWVALHRAWHPQGLEILAIAMPYDRPDRVLQFAADHRLPFPVALDPLGEALAAWGGVPATPTSWLIGLEGRVVRGWVGRDNLARLHAEIGRLLPPDRVRGPTA